MVEAEVDVYVELNSVDVHAGRMYAHRRRNQESVSFSYQDTYLSHRDAYPLDPALPLGTGAYHSRPGQIMFGAFSDCAPDRWGRRLAQRAEKQRAQREHTTPRTMGEVDFLLGVRDDLRQGALRFRDARSGEFLASDRTGVPPLVELPHLLSAADRLESDTEKESDVTLLLHGGSSLGGARPKAHVEAGDGRLAIAKFPSKAGDDWDVMGWEKVALDLARRAGIRTPPSELVKVLDKNVHVIERFDRRDGARIGFVSAMTMLEATDGQQHSYLEIAEVIEQTSPAAEADLRELWRRIVFSVLISNTDDHLRNHGFLREKGQWRLSPVFDVNPNPMPGNRRLSTMIDLDDDAASIDNAIAVAPYFRMSGTAAGRCLAEVDAAVSSWRDVAQRLAIPAKQIELMESAFRPGPAYDL